jgi:hypothetical protein
MRRQAPVRGLKLGRHREYFVGELKSTEGDVNRVAIACLSVLFYAAVLAAQSTDRPTTRLVPGAAPGAGSQMQPGTAFGVSCFAGPGRQGCLVPNACPVTLQATHLADGSFIQTGDAHSRGIGQWLSLSFAGTAGNEKQIVTARVIVHGVKPNAHVTQALSLANGSDDIVRTFTIPLARGQHRDAQGNEWVEQDARANLWVPGMSAVDRIVLVLLSYGDGSTWTAAEGGGCSVIPDPKMLIVSR